VSTASAAASELVSSGFHEAARLVSLLAARLDQNLDGMSPSRIALASALAAAFGIKVAAMLLDARRSVRRRGLLFLLFIAAKQLPVIKTIVKREKQKMIDEMDADMTSKMLAEGVVPAKLTRLPPTGNSIAWVRGEANARQQKDTKWNSDRSTMSGAVYVADSKHFNLLSGTRWGFPKSRHTVHCP